MDNTEFELDADVERVEGLPFDKAALEAAVNRTEAKRCFSRLGLGSFVILAAATLLQLLAAGLINYFEPAWVSETWALWVLTFAPLYCVAIPLGLLVMRSVPKYPVDRGPFGTGSFLTLIPVCFFLMYAGNLIGVAITSILGELKGGEVVNPLESYALGGGSLVVKILFMVVLAPLIEELIFRRALIDRMRIYGEKNAVLVSALIFGLFHGNLSQFFYAFALGLVFGYVYVKTGRLRYSAALHMLINCMGSVVAPALLESADIDRLYELDSSTLISNPELLGELITPGLLLFALYSLLLVAFSILGLVLLCVNAKRLSFAPAERELPREIRFKTVWCNAGMILFALLCLGTIISSILL